MAVAGATLGEADIVAFDEGGDMHQDLGGDGGGL